MNFKMVIRPILKKRGQLGNQLVTFAMIVFTLMIAVPILFKIVTSVVGGVSAEITNSSAIAGTESANVLSKFQSVLDGAIMLSFFLMIVIMLVTAFLIDVHPAFMVVYVIVAVVLFLLVPIFSDVVDNIWDNSEFLSQQADLPMLNFLRNNIGIILVGVYGLSGIVLFLKIRGGMQ